MASQAAQTKAQALNVKLEGEARAVIDDIEKNHLRKVAKQAFSCAVKCYDKAGATGPSDVLDQCVQNCQMPHRQKQQYVQNVCVMSCCSCWRVSAMGSAMGSADGLDSNDFILSFHCSLFSCSYRKLVNFKLV